MIAAYLPPMPPTLARLLTPGLIMAVTAAGLAQQYYFDASGVGDATTALQNALNFAGQTGVVKIGPGTLNFLGPGLTLPGSSLRMRGSGIGTTKINLAAGINLVDFSGTYGIIDVGDFTLNTGAGGLHFTKTTANVNNHLHVVERIEFAGFTACAIGHNSSDDPFWRISDCIFNPANSTTSIAIALAGLGGSSEIQNCEFLAGAVHIKLARGGNEYRVNGCDFIQAGAGASRVSGLWILPDATGVNAGQGLIVSGNKFGNENQDPTDYHVLYADGSGGADFTTDLFNVGADSTGFIIGHSFTDNDYSAAAGAGPTIYSTTPNVQGCAYSGSIKGTNPSYFIQYRTVPLAPNRLNSRNYFGPFQLSQASETVTVPLSNATGVGYIIDPDGVLEDNQAAINPGMGDSAGLARLAPDLVNNWTLIGGATKVAATDSEGSTDAIELTATAATDGIRDNLTTANIVLGAPVWIAFELAPGSSLPMATITVKVEYTSAGNNQFWQRVLNVPAVPTPFHFPLFIRSTSTTVRVLFSATGWVNGTATKVQIGRARVYTAKAPVPYSVHAFGGLYPGNASRGFQQVCAIYAGSGAPSNADGINGDLYLRSDGTQNGLTVVYHKEGGAWALVTDPTFNSLLLSAAASRIIPGATSLSLRNNANSADNLLVTDAGIVTLRNTLHTKAIFADQLVGLPTAANLIAGVQSVTFTAGSNDRRGSFSLVTTVAPPAANAKLFDLVFNSTTLYATAPIVIIRNLVSGATSTTRYVGDFTANAVTALQCGVQCTSVLTASGTFLGGYVVEPMT